MSAQRQQGWFSAGGMLSREAKVLAKVVTCVVWCGVASREGDIAGEG